jgi:hypothetical protein
MNIKTLGGTLNDVFGNARIKNVPGSNERLSFVKNSFDQIKMNYDIFPAYDGKKFTNQSLIINHGRFNIGYPSSAGFVGNQISTFVILLNEINYYNSNSFMIFDDDCYFLNFENENNFNSIKDNLPDNWDVIIFGNVEPVISSSKDYTYKKVSDWRDCAGSHGIAVNKKVYLDWLYILDGAQYWGDGTIHRLFELGHNIYKIFPGICAQNRNLFSDINQGFHKDKTGFNK